MHPSLTPCEHQHSFCACTLLVHVRYACRGWRVQTPIADRKLDCLTRPLCARTIAYTANVHHNSNSLQSIHARQPNNLATDGYNVLPLLELVLAVLLEDLHTPSLVDGDTSRLDDGGSEDGRLDGWETLAVKVGCGGGTRLNGASGIDKLL